MNWVSFLKGVATGVPLGVVFTSVLVLSWIKQAQRRRGGQS